MERALYVSRIEDLEFFTNENRLYFGNEFCENLIPSLDDFRRAWAFCRENGLDLSIVTPQVTNAGIKRVSAILDSGIGLSEVIINDYGVLEMLRDSDLAKVLGRLLTVQIKEPRLSRDDRYAGFLRTNVLDLDEFKVFLRENGIRRAEIENSAQGFSFRPVKGLGISIYYPYVYVTMTRRCLYNRIEDPSSMNKLYISGCGKECQRYSIRYRFDGKCKKIMIRGNAQFYRNDKVFGHPAKFGIDRFVFMPKIPL